MPTPNWREESVSVAGIDVHFYRGGEGPPLVLLHGGDPNPGSAPAMVDHQID